MEEGQREGVWRQGRREPRARLDRRVAALRGGGEAGHCSGAAGRRGVATLEALFPVSLQHVGEAEALAAHAAGVRFLARVGAAVALHVGPAGEALAADFTDERFLSCNIKEDRSQQLQQYKQVKTGRKTSKKTKTNTK